MLNGNEQTLMTELGTAEEVPKRRGHKYFILRIGNSLRSTSLFLLDFM